MCVLSCARALPLHPYPFRILQNCQCMVDFQACSHITSHFYLCLQWPLNQHAQAASSAATVGCASTSKTSVTDRMTVTTKVTSSTAVSTSCPPCVLLVERAFVTSFWYHCRSSGVKLPINAPRNKKRNNYQLASKGNALMVFLCFHHALFILYCLIIPVWTLHLPSGPFCALCLIAAVNECVLTADVHKCVLIADVSECVFDCRCEWLFWLQMWMSVFWLQIWMSVFWLQMWMRVFWLEVWMCFDCRCEWVCFNCSCEWVCFDWRNEWVLIADVNECVFTADMNKRVLTADVNECESARSNQCGHECHDTLTSYKCVCNSGYRLMTDRHHCRGENWILKAERGQEVVGWGREGGVCFQGWGCYGIGLGGGWGGVCLLFDAQRDHGLMVKCAATLLLSMIFSSYWDWFCFFLS